MNTAKFNPDEFMIEEYRQVAQGYHELSKRHVELLKFYMALIAVPASVLAIILKLIGITTIAEIIKILPGIKPFINAAIAILALGGWFLFIEVIDIASTTTTYLMTINLIRKYFSDKSIMECHTDLKNYLKLPTSDKILINPSAINTINALALINSLITSLFIYMMFEEANNSIMLSNAVVVIALITISVYFTVSIACKKISSDKNQKSNNQEGHNSSMGYCRYLYSCDNTITHTAKAFILVISIVVSFYLYVFLDYMDIAKYFYYPTVIISLITYCFFSRSWMFRITRNEKQLYAIEKQRKL